MSVSNQPSAIQQDPLAELLGSELSSEAEIARNTPSQRMTTFGVGGAVPRTVRIHSMEDLLLLHHLSIRKGFPTRIIGAGSNLCLPDTPLDDVVIQLGREFSGPYHPAPADIQEPDGRIETVGRTAEREGLHHELRWFGAATPLMTLSRKMSEGGFGGLEFAAGIPAQLGGAVRMNAGAHGSAIRDVLTSVLIVEPPGVVRELAVDALNMGYRSTTLPEGAIVIAAQLKLHRSDPETLMNERSRCLLHRKKTQPLQLPSAGSTFKNPSGVTVSCANQEVSAVDSAPPTAAGALLEAAGMKGESCGGVEFSALHANWIVRTGRVAAQAEVRSLIERGQTRVLKQCGVTLQPEVLFW